MSTSIQIVTPGDLIVEDDSGFLRGHGTYSVEGRLYASVCGVVERVNKLISVVPLKSRYQGHVGDVVVGRVQEVGNKRWKVDINSNQDAVLLLSAINLPGGVQRRRTYEDQLNMRHFFVEDDLISAEVQQFFQQDGSMALQTRSTRYGKLKHGQLIEVSPSLIKRCKQHFHSFAEYGVDMVLGLNGYIWLTPTRIAAMMTIQAERDTEESVIAESAGGTSLSRIQAESKTITKEEREALCRVRNAISALASQFILVSPETISDVVDDSLQMSLSVVEMLDPSRAQELTARAASRRQSDFYS
nr:exosome complex component RRP4 [Seculamonas ecuadoriensis]